ncbi:putative small protein containing a coiled-coil domain [Leptolyngbyaceae cyanobacterium JSC-12]|nr:putative small protein containing a coiled-coil domain [Leptolyngbyaceae cyanobacterium JSC-12]
MLQTEITTLEDLRVQIKRLNSKAGQMKMDLHDLAEGLPTDYDKLMDVAGETYAIFKQIDDLKKQLKQLEKHES